MKKYNIKSLFLLTLLLFGLTVTNINQTKAITTNVKVGLLTPMTGALSAYSLGFEQGAQLAINHLNNDPSINTSYTFSLSMYDTQTDPTASVNAMTQAVTNGAHYVVGAAGSSNTLAAAAVAVANQIPLISYASTSPALSVYDDHAILGDNGYLWRIPPSDANQGEVISKLAFEGGFRNIVIVALDNAYGSGLSGSVNETFIAQGGNVNAILTYLGTTIDFSALVTQVKDSNPDIVVAISYISDGAKLFVEMVNQNLNVPIIGSDGVDNVAIFAEHVDVQSAMQGFLTVKPIPVDSPESDGFKNAYSTAFTNTLGHIYHGEAYDAVWAGALAIAAKGSVVGQDIIEGLSLINWQGASGPISFDQYGDSTAGFYQISEVRLDQMEAVATWDKINGTSYLDSTFYNKWIGTSTTVKVGLLAPQTGPLSGYALGFEQAAQFAISELNSNPEFMKYNFNLFTYDTKTNPTGAVEAMTRVVTAGDNFVIGAAGSDVTLAAARIAKENKIPLISYGATSRDITTYEDHAMPDDKGYLWRIPGSDAIKAAAVSEFTTLAKFSTMTIVYNDNMFGRTLMNEINHDFLLRGGLEVKTIGYREPFDEYQTLIQEVKSYNSDVVVLIPHTSDGDILSGMFEYKLTIPLIVVETDLDVSIFSLLADYPNSNQEMILLKHFAPQNNKMLDFNLDFATKYGSSGVEPYIHEAYDAIYTGALAIKMANSLNGEDIISTLATLSYEGVSGMISFDENGDRQNIEYGVYGLKDNSLDLIAMWHQNNSFTQIDETFIDQWSQLGRANVLTNISSSTITSFSTTTTTTSTLPITTATITTPTTTTTTSDQSIRVPFSTFGLFAAIIFVNLITRVVRRK